MPYFPAPGNLFHLVDVMKNTADETQSEDQARIENSEALETIEPGHVTPEQLSELKERAAKADENWDRLLRVTADLENFKKRAAREKTDAIKYANENLLQKLIPTLDNIDMALAAAQTADSSDTAQT